jgi:hypothetical protein
MIETFKKFSGGEVDWNAWAEDFKIMVDTRSEQMGAALEYVRGWERWTRRWLDGGS